MGDAIFPSTPRNELGRFFRSPWVFRKIAIEGVHPNKLEAPAIKVFKGF